MEEAPHNTRTHTHTTRFLGQFVFGGSRGVSSHLPGYYGPFVDVASAYSPSPPATAAQRERDAASLIRVDMSRTRP